MVPIEEKIIELSKLLSNNILTSDEFNKIVAVLRESNHITNHIGIEKSIEEIKYINYMDDYVIPKFRAPITAKYPTYNSSMIKMVAGFIDSSRVIETYLDSQNSFGAMIRTGIRIEIDDDFNLLGVKVKNPGLLSMWVSI